MADGKDRWAALKDDRGPERANGRSRSGRGYGWSKYDRRDDFGRGNSYSRGGRTTSFKTREELEREDAGDTPMVMRRKPPGEGDAAAGELNPASGRPYSPRYYELLEARKQLPIYNHKESVLKTVGENRFVVLVGDTGSGKTTQVPQMLCLQNAGPKSSGKKKMIACTQPRRIAAVTVSQRVAEEMDVRLGEEVGYAIRYEDETSSRTLLKYCTDGLLLRESVSDPDFKAYGMIIIDEAHERTISTDILMGLLKQVAYRRDDFRLVIMSATLDAEKLQRYFDDAPLLKIPGRMFPVTINYSNDVVEDYLEAAVNSVVDIHLNEAEGDILMFLTGEDEISNACKDIVAKVENAPGKGHPRGVHVLPLYSSLPPNAIQKVFQAPPQGRRKIVVSTNVAETSLTIDGIVYVVDPGFAKQKVYNPRNRVESLQVAPVSAASAVQRTGRAGRTRPGVCYRLYTEDTFEELVAMTYPEILRSNLNSVVLQLRTLAVNPVQFDFLDPPPPETVMRALEGLLYLGALDARCEVTKLGKTMSILPLDPELGRILLAAPELGVAQEVLAIVAMLSAAPNCFVRPANKTREADQAKKRFEAEESDHLTLLNVYAEFMEHRYHASDWCWGNFLNERALESAAKAKEQLERLLIEQGYSARSKRSFDYNGQSIAIRKALTRGSFMYSAVTCKRATYLTTKDNVEVKLHPASGMRTRPTWVIYNELVITTKAFIRTVTEVDGLWLLEASPDYYQPSQFTNDLVALEIGKLTGARRKGKSANNNSLRQAY